MRIVILSITMIFLVATISLSQFRITEKELDFEEGFHSVLAGIEEESNYNVLTYKLLADNKKSMSHSTKKLVLYKLDSTFSRKGINEIDYDLTDTKVICLGISNNSFFVMAERRLNRRLYEQSLLKIDFTGNVSSHLVRIDQIPRNERNGYNSSPIDFSFKHSITPDKTKIGLVYNRRSIGIQCYIYDILKDEIVSNQALELPENFKKHSKISFGEHFCSDMILTNEQEFHLMFSYIHWSGFVKSVNKVGLVKIRDSIIEGDYLSDENYKAFHPGALFRNGKVHYLYLTQHVQDGKEEQFVHLLDQDKNKLDSCAVDYSFISSLVMGKPQSHGMDIFINLTSLRASNYAEETGSILTLKIDSDNKLSSFITSRSLGYGPSQENLHCSLLDSNTILFSCIPKRSGTFFNSTEEENFFIRRFDESDHIDRKLKTQSELYMLEFDLFDDKRIVLGREWENSRLFLYKLEGT